jgi:soluble lytic murein transglycosylase-like protein
MMPWILAGLLMCGGVQVDLDALIEIESGGNPKAFNKSSHARGILQITPVVAEEWNRYHPKDKLTDLNDLCFPEVSLKVARWYLGVRIPQMLKHFKKPITVRNILICYNAGINYVVTGKELPHETKNYISKYEQIVSN